jgi:preprotein translocase subunit SecG
MGLSVKTGGAATASGSVVDGLLKTNGSALNAAVVTKVMIDIWIGVISFVLAIVWTYRVRKRTNAKVNKGILWYRFLKLVLGYLLTSAIYPQLLLCIHQLKWGQRQLQL